MTRTNEAFSRVKIDAQLKDQGWEVPKDLIAVMRSHEVEVIRLLDKIEVLITEVQA